MNCTQCHTPNKPGGRFCLKCAAPLGNVGGWAASALGGSPHAPSGASGYAAPRGAARPGQQAARFEGWLEGYVTFDGEVLEGFNWRQGCSGRLHVAVIADAQLQSGGGNMGCINVTTVFGPGNLLVHFHENQRAQAEHLAQLIRSARRR